MPILWAPGVFAFFLQENLHVHKIPRFRGAGYFGLFFGGGDFIFMGAGIFQTHIQRILNQIAKPLLGVLSQLLHEILLPVARQGPTRSARVWALSGKKKV